MGLTLVRGQLEIDHAQMGSGDIAALAASGRILPLISSDAIPVQYELEVRRWGLWSGYF